MKVCIGCNSFDEMVDKKNFYPAFLAAYKGNSSRPSSEKYLNNLSKNLAEARRLLVTGKYKVGKYTTFMVYEPKPRKIKALPFKDRVIQHVLFDYINPRLDKTFIFYSYANRNGKGIHKGIEVEKGFLRKCGKGSYVIKGDIYHFFDSIDKDILMRLLYKKIRDIKILNLCRQFIYMDKKPTGIAIGNVTSQLFANVYLNELDHFVKDRLRIKNYIRYMDDFCINVKTKQEAKEILEKITIFLKEKLHLLLNGKTQIFPERQGVNFLGGMIKFSHVKIRHKTVKRIKHNINKWKKRLQDETMSRDLYIAVLYKQFNSWFGLASKLNCRTIIIKIYQMIEQLGIADPLDGKTNNKERINNIKKLLKHKYFLRMVTENTFKKIVKERKKHDKIYKEAEFYNDMDYKLHRFYDVYLKTGTVAFIHPG